MLKFAYQLGVEAACKEAGFDPAALKTLLRRIAVGAGVGGLGGAAAGYGLTQDASGAGKGALVGSLIGALSGGKIPMSSRVWT